MKRILSLLVLLCLLCSLPAGCGSKNMTDTSDAKMTAFTDSLGRTVEVPAQIDRIAVTGPMTQLVLFALCPDKLVGISTAWSNDAAAFLDDKYLDLPVLGQLYGGKGELNLETLLGSGAQVVIDVGEDKAGIAEEMDSLQKQTGLPFIHITASTRTTGDAFRLLGHLLGLPDEGEALGSYCDSVYARTCEIAGSVDKVNLLYCMGDLGQNIIAAGSYHAEVIDMLSNNLAVIDSPSGKGTGNEVNMEQILQWNPDVILFAPGSIYEIVSSDPAWQQMSAIRTGRYYEVPYGPYNWMGFPPSVQRYLGMMWMSQLLYPDAAGYDLYTEAARYFQLFYHYELTAEQYTVLVKHSIGVQEEQ
ncbi:MAG: ABC transporter substrate-binding protein [Oscillibacter sp.]|nr:ABC transporter substrate-binding protein [Oscillibacter sp.]